MTKDPAFLFYPGDASEDTQFMNRLERGAYFDILKAQKKFNRFSIDQIKKVLGSDFAACWPSIELVLGKDDKGYFIEWLDSSIKKRKEHSKIQKDRIDNYWAKKNQTDTNNIPPINHGNTTEQPLGNGIENENTNENKDKGGLGEKYLVPQMAKIYKKYFTNYFFDKERDYKPLYSIAKFLCGQGNVNGPPENHQDEILEVWEPICQYITTDNFYKQKPLSTISNQIQELTSKARYGDQSATKTKRTGLDDNKLKDAISKRLRGQQQT